MILQAYMDESGTDDNSPLLSVAGYVFAKRQAKQFSRQWTGALQLSSIGKPTKAEYFRMSDCAHREGQFKGWEKADCLDIEKKLIKQIQKRTMFGFAVTLNEDDYNTHLAGKHGMPSAYAFACFGCLMVIRRWIKRENIFGKVTYIFESGHEHQRNANGFLEEIFSVARARQEYLYAGHAFMPKEDAPPLQAGDILAWQSIKNRLRFEADQPPRKDMEALAREDVDRTLHYDVDAMLRMADALQAKGIPDDDEPFTPRRALKKAEKQ